MFRFSVGIPREIRTEAGLISRDEFYSLLWKLFEPFKLLGIDQGTVLSEEAKSLGFETESWTVDAGLAPANRDWIDGQAVEQALFYFKNREQAEGAIKILVKSNLLSCATSPHIEAVKEEDWNSTWKKNFTGVEVAPFWKIVPPWVETKFEPNIELETRPNKNITIRINPGAGFGTGTHETTQLCLEAIGNLANLSGFTVLDFGSGSGILAIAAALLGAKVDAVEIDSLAIDNANENARLNQVSVRIAFSDQIPNHPNKYYDCVIANILKPVLLENAALLVSKIKPGGYLILSGLVENDLSDVLSCYSKYLKSKLHLTLSKGDWRALVWKNIN